MKVAPALSVGELRESPRYNALDGIRVIAVLLVVSWHVRSGAFESLHGSNGVTLFFILSGFLITALAMKEERVQGRFHYGAFLIRRAFRILPLLWIGLAAYAVMIFGLHLDDRADSYRAAIPWALGYLPEVPVFRAGPALDHGQGAVPFSGIWSLGIEEKFYLVWPLLAFVLLKKRRGREVIALGAAAALWVLHITVDEPFVKYVMYYAPIFLGCAIALAMHTDVGNRIFKFISHPLVAIPVVGVSIFLDLITPSPTQDVLLQLSMGVIIATLVMRPMSIAGRVLGSRTASTLGALTYATYLFHSLGLKVVDLVLPEGKSIPLALASMVTGLAVTLVAAAVLHALIEVPLQEMGRKLAAQLKGRKYTGPVQATDIRHIEVLPPSIRTEN